MLKELLNNIGQNSKFTTRENPALTEITGDTPVWDLVSGRGIVDKSSAMYIKTVTEMRFKISAADVYSIHGDKITVSQFADYRGISEPEINVFLEEVNNALKGNF